MHVYDPDQITMTFAGIRITGWADGEFVRIARNNDSFTLQKGTDGTGTRSKSKDKSGRVSFILMQTSPVNARLAALHRLDETAPNGAGVGELRIKDLNGETLHTAKEAWIVKPPDANYDRTATSREWIIEADELEMFDGGN